MNHWWKQAPFLRLFIPFSIGIIFYIYFPINQFWLACSIVILLLVAYLFFEFQNIQLKFKNKFYQGIVLQCLLLALGYLVTFTHNIVQQKKWYKNYSATNYPYTLVRIDNEVEEKPNSYKAFVEIKKLVNNTHELNTTGNALIYFAKNEKSKLLKEGDWVLVKNNFVPIHQSNNPGSFNYANYCKLKNIYESAYIKENEFDKTAKNTQTIFTIFNSWNAKTRNILNKYITDKNTVGVAEALLIGYRKNVDADTWQSYSNTGIVHVIAISGMHMAMVYGTIVWFLLRIQYLKKNKKSVYIIAMLAMWLFACVTGLPPSVTRSAVMFTFIGLGEMSNQKISNVNNLLASAFLLLCIQPLWILDVGFQLSYLAVFSLIVFYEKIYHLLYVSNYFLDKIWALLAGTIAAQIFTFPLLIYYFHQFPLLFFITNLIAIPLTTIILYSEIFLLLISCIKPIAFLVGKIISATILLLNNVVLFFNTINSATITGLQINILQVLLLFMFIAYTAYWIFTKKRHAIFMALCSFLVFSISVLYVHFTVLQQQKMVVFASNKQKSLVFIQGNHYQSFNNELDTNSNYQKFVLQPAKTFFQLKQKDSVTIPTLKNNNIELINYQNKTIARVSNTQFVCNQKLKVDYLIFSDKANPTIQWIQDNFNAKQLIFDSSIPFWKIKQLKENIATVTIPTHFVQESGAFITNL